MCSYSYVTKLEDRVERMEALLKRVRMPFELENLYSASSVQRLLRARDSCFPGIQEITKAPFPLLFLQCPELSN